MFGIIFFINYGWTIGVGTHLAVSLFSKAVSEIGINKYDHYECWEQRNSHLHILFLSQQTLKTS